MVDKVFPGQPIKASTINGMIDAVTNGWVTGAPSNLFYYPREILVKNTTQDVWSACTPIGIVQANPLDETLEFAINKYLTCGAIVQGGVIDSNTPVFRIGVTKESIQPDCLGKCSIPGLMAAKVNITDWSHDYVKYDTTNHYLISTGDSKEAQFCRICGVSMRSLGIALCFISPLAGVGSAAINFVITNGSTEEKDTVFADGRYVVFRNVSGHPNRVLIKGAQWVLHGPQSVVTSVVCDASGDLVVKTQRIELDMVDDD